VIECTVIDTRRKYFFPLLLVSSLCLLSVSAPPAWPQAPSGSQVHVNLPFDLVDTLDGAKFKIRVPANWNGTLLVYVQGTKVGAPPPEPSLVPPVLPGSDAPLADTLLSRGYALAASEISPADFQIKAELQDTHALTTYFRGRVGEPTRVVLWGSSMGGLVSLRLMEDYPRSFDGAIALCAPAAGSPRTQDRYLDFGLAYAVVFGWPDDAWGPLENLRSGLNFATDVNPVVNWPKSDGSNRGGWEFIRLVNGLAPAPFWQTDPMNGRTGFFLQMLFATWFRALAQDWAAGPVAQNVDHEYSLTSDERTYLAGLGVPVDDLLAKLNARRNIEASPLARDYITRFGGVRGNLEKPVLTMHTTLDTLIDSRHESAYLKSVEFWSRQENLVQVYVQAVGHNAYTAKQLLAALAAMESWLDTGTKPGPAAFPAELGFDNAFVPPPWPY
jgi:pimeloyl-ACP methyl ester carboxylesterase